ncbi:MAG: hypothetical protein RL095_4147 [Verrucomicrobiota bacterium]|jgi:hypothetical protein
MNLILSLLLASSAPAPSVKAETPLRALVPIVSAPEWQSFLDDLALAEFQARFDPGLSQRCAALSAKIPDTSRGKLLRLTLQSRTAIAAKDPLLFRQSYREGFSLMAQVGDLPAAELLEFLCSRMRQTITLNQFISPRLYQQNLDSHQNCQRQIYLCVVRLLSGAQAQSSEDELREKLSLLQNWMDSAPISNASDDLNLPRIKSPSTALEVFARAAYLRMHPGGKNWRSEAEAIVSLLEAQIRQHPGLVELRIQQIALRRDLGASPEELRDLVEPAFKTAPRDPRLHGIWASCLRPECGGSAAQLKERIETLSADAEAVTKLGQPLFLIYLEALLACEGPEVLQENWVSQSLVRRLELMESQPAGPLQKIHRTQLIARLLPSSDMSLPRVLRRYDLVQDLDYSLLRPEIQGPLDLARRCVGPEEMKLLEKMEKVLDWELGRPLESEVPATQIGEWAEALEKAALSAEHPHAASCCRHWARLCRLHLEFLRGEWVALDLDDPWLWRRSSGDFQSGAEGLLASSMYGKSMLAQHRGVFPPPFEVEVELRPVKVFSDTYQDRCNFFGIACGDLRSRPISGRILFSDPSIGWSGCCGMQPYINVYKTKEIPAPLRAWIWPFEGEVSRDPINGSCSTNEEFRIPGELHFRAGALGIGCPYDADGAAIFQKFRLRRNPLPAIPPAEPEAAMKYWAQRNKQFPRQEKIILYIKSALSANQPKTAAALLKALPTRLPPGVNELDRITIKIETDCARIAELSAEVQAALGHWPEAVAEMRQSMTMTPDDEGFEAARRRMRLAAFLARNAASGAAELQEARDSIAFVLRQNSPELRLHAWWARAWMERREGRTERAQEAFETARMLAKENAPELLGKMDQEARESAR